MCFKGIVCLEDVQMRLVEESDGLDPRPVVRRQGTVRELDMGRIEEEIHSRVVWITSPTHTNGRAQGQGGVSVCDSDVVER